MHGVRRAEAQLGETACVIGLGLVGQLVVRLLIAAGVRVVGLDVIEDRCLRAEQAGATACAAPTAEGVAAIEQALAELTGGRGADHVFLAAGGDSNGPVETAVKLARDRAKVVDIGKTKLDLPWNAYYDKELDVRFSRSYGPGRYDDRYELERHRLPGGLRPVDRAAQHRVASSTSWRTRRSRSRPWSPACSRSTRPPRSTRTWPRARCPRSGYCWSTRPRWRRRRRTRCGRWSRPRAGPRPRPRRTGWRSGSSGPVTTPRRCCCRTWPSWTTVRLAHVATNRSLSAANAQRRFGFTAASTSADAVLDDASLDAIFIVTRHHTHADLVCRALETGKAVFVEKPLALTREELDRIAAVVERTGNDRLMVGFNRRFAPLLDQLKTQIRPGRSTAR